MKLRWDRSKTILRINLFVGLSLLLYAGYWYGKLNSFAEHAQKTTAPVVGFEQRWQIWNIGFRNGYRQYHPVVRLKSTLGLPKKVLAVSRGYNEDDEKDFADISEVILVGSSDTGEDVAYLERDFHEVRNYVTIWSSVFGMCCLAWYAINRAILS